MRAAALTFALVACGHTNAALLAAAEATVLVDWHQTMWMTSRQPMVSEANPLLGQYPGPLRVTLTIGAGMTLLAAGHWVLPSWAQKILYGGVLGVELGNVARNHAVIRQAERDGL